MPPPFAPRPAQKLTVPEYLTFGLYVLCDIDYFDEISLHKMVLDNIAGAESGERGRLNQWKTNSRLRFEIIPAPPIVAMYEAFMPFFGISDDRQNLLNNADYLIAVVTEQDMSKETDLSAFRVLQVAAALTASAYNGLILDPLCYKVFDTGEKEHGAMLAAYTAKDPLRPLLSAVQTVVETTESSDAPMTMTSTSGLCRFSLPEIAIEKTASLLAPKVKDLIKDIAGALLKQMSVEAEAGQKEISLEAPLMVRGKPVFLRLQHSKLGPVLNLNLRGRQAEREESLKSLL